MTNQSVLELVLLVAWVAWWLWGVNWQRAWPVLSVGGWVPLVLLVFAAALTWSQLSPSELHLFGFLRAPNFWWQFGGVSTLAALALAGAARAAWRGYVHFDAVCSRTDQA